MTTALLVLPCTAATLETRYSPVSLRATHFNSKWTMKVSVDKKRQWSDDTTDYWLAPPTTNIYTTWKEKKYKSSYFFYKKRNVVNGEHGWGHVCTTYQRWCTCRTLHVGLDLSLQWWWCQTIGDRVIVNLHHTCDIWATPSVQDKVPGANLGDRVIVCIHHLLYDSYMIYELLHL
jgi:hypothetical protein